MHCWLQTYIACHHRLLSSSVAVSKGPVARGTRPTLRKNNIIDKNFLIRIRPETAEQTSSPMRKVFVSACWGFVTNLQLPSRLFNINLNLTFSNVGKSSDSMLQKINTYMVISCDKPAMLESGLQLVDPGVFMEALLPECLEKTREIGVCWFSELFCMVSAGGLR